MKKPTGTPSAMAWALTALGSLAVTVFGGTALAESQSRPAVTIAPFVLKSTILDGNSTNAYRPWFENRKWTGDLIEYHVFASGQRCTSVAVGKFPPDDSGNAGSCIDGEDLIQNWSARGAFPDVIEDPITGTISDDPRLEDYWIDERNLFVYRPGAGPTNTSPFLWDSLTVNQRQALDPDTCGGIVAGDCQSGLDGAQDSVILNYVRGDRSLETDRGGVLRRRFSLLGAVINSRPVYVPAQNGLVMVGSNGGVVHGFSAVDGSEIFGYVPSQFLPHLRALSDPGYDYNFRFFADGELRYARTSAGEHVVAGGLGSGGKGFFILDVSTPSAPRVLMERSGTPGAHLPTMHDPNLGFIHGRPSIARLPDGEWYVVTGNGFGSTNGGARLILVRLSDGQVTRIDTTALGPDNGLAAPALVDINNNGQADYAYAGDLEGNLWRFGLSEQSRHAVRLFRARSIGGQTQPITIEPDIARHPSQIGVMIYFGTGRLLGHLDASTLERQTIYGIWDREYLPDDEVVSVIDDLFEQTLVEKEGNWLGEPRLVRVIENESYTGPNWDEHKGWRVDLPRLGERLLGRPQIRAERLQFITNNPTYAIDSIEYQSANWFNQLSLASGGSLQPPKALYDLDRSGVLNEGDAYTETVAGVERRYFPLGLNLGPGIVSQPAFARVTTDIDAVFINGVIMLPPPESNPNIIQRGGDLDVTTDSPHMRLANPHDPGHPSYNPQYPDFSSSPWANLPASVTARGPMNIRLDADGSGNRVDGHHRAYNRVHGVSYVDYFDIEPRAQRGQLRLDPGTVDSDGNPFVAIRELNQPTKDVNGTPLFGGDQKFIVVLTNADLSQGTEIKIGCRTWPTFAYQNMVASQLRANPDPRQLRDTIHSNATDLIFTLDEIDPAIAGPCPDDSEPTLRISLTGQVGDEHPTSGQDVVIATLPGCVGNTHNLDGTLKTPGTNPHITPVKNYPSGSGSSGYRWRNGALTMQLLRVNSDGTRAFDLQTVGLPEGRANNPTGIGWGGIYAKGFEFVDIIDPKNGRVTGQKMVVLSNPDNGLLFESSLFWNYGDMKEFQQQGQDLVCFGDNNWSGFRRTEWDGLNSSQYSSLVENLRGDENELKDQYIAALAMLQSEATVDEGLRLLAAIFGTPVGSWAQGRGPEYADLLLGYYDRMRSYAKRDNLKLLDIDRDLFVLPPPPEVREDLTPAQVDDVEVDLLPAAGPNYAPGRRSWIDLTPN